MSIVRMTEDEVRKLPPLTKEEIDRINAFEDKDISDCPELTDEQLAQLRPLREVHPEWYKVTVAKTPVQIRIDNDVLEVLKSEGKGYQTKINAILRKYVFG